jgi:hypothetical protein
MISEADLTAEKFVRLFLKHYVCTHGVSTEIVSDRDIGFQSVF